MITEDYVFPPNFSLARVPKPNLFLPTESTDLFETWAHGSEKCVD